MMQLDDLAIDAQMNELFYSMVQYYSVEHAGEILRDLEDELQDEYVSSLALVPIGLDRFTLARETFALIGWTLLLCADLDKGCFLSPFLKAVHCKEKGGTVCSLEFDPRNYFQNEEYTSLSPVIIKDIDTSLICCCENSMSPLKFVMDAVEQHPIIDEDYAGCCKWDAFDLHMNLFMAEFKNDSEKICITIEELLNVQCFYLE